MVQIGLKLHRLFDLTSFRGVSRQPFYNSSSTIEKNQDEIDKITRTSKLFIDGKLAIEFNSHFSDETRV